MWELEVCTLQEAANSHIFSKDKTIINSRYLKELGSAPCKSRPGQFTRGSTAAGWHPCLPVGTPISVLGCPLARSGVTQPSQLRPNSWLLSSLKIQLLNHLKFWTYSEIIACLPNSTHKPRLSGQQWQHRQDTMAKQPSTHKEASRCYSQPEPWECRHGLICAPSWLDWKEDVEKGLRSRRELGWLYTASAQPAEWGGAGKCINNLVFG